jgi:hypothetical protein
MKVSKTLQHKNRQIASVKMEIELMLHLGG